MYMYRVYHKLTNLRGVEDHKDRACGSKDEEKWKNTRHRLLEIFIGHTTNDTIFFYIPITNDVEIDFVLEYYILCL